MKKIILTLLLGGLMMTGLSAKTAFVYFSATGTTERMAKIQVKQEKKRKLMTKPQRLRMSIDITMTILSIMLMYGKEASNRKQ